MSHRVNLDARDPRKDPRPGDVVRKGTNERHVETRRETVVEYRKGAGRPLQVVWLSFWKQWAKNAEVLHVAS